MISSPAKRGRGTAEGGGGAATDTYADGPARAGKPLVRGRRIRHAGCAKGYPKGQVEDGGAGCDPKNIFAKLYPRPQNLPHNPRRPSCRERFRSRSKAGKDRRLRWRDDADPLPEEVPSKGSPAATDERCVLDEHIGGTGEGACLGLPVTLPGANACRRRNRPRAAERTKHEIAGRAGVEAPVLFFEFGRA